MGRDSNSKKTLERRDASRRNLGGLDDLRDGSNTQLNTFEKLNEQIQQSIASLKKMSD